MDPMGPDPGGPEGGGPAEPADTGAVDPGHEAPPEPTGDTVDAPPQAMGEAETTVVPTPAPVDTETAVATQAVEPPPVQIATVERPAGPRRVGGRKAAIVAIVGVVAIGAVAYVGYNLNQDLSSTRASLASTQDDLGSTQSTLDDKTTKLATTKKDLEAANAQKADLDSQVTDLSAQVATQTQCVTLQRAALAELVVISELQTQNYNRTTIGSAWDTAEKRRGDGVTTALDEFYKAYSAAFQGSKGTAKTHADLGKAAQAKIADAEQRLLNELKLIDTKNTEIETAINNLETQIKTTESTCEEAAP